MKIGITLAGVVVLAVAIIVEVAGVLYANGFLAHNAYGIGGGVLAVLGIIAISVGIRSPIKEKERLTVPANCQYCGAKLSEGAEYCLNCGKVVEHAPAY
jgi:hypothetical protein